MIRLHRMALSGHCHRVELFLSLLGLPYERVDAGMSQYGPVIPRGFDRGITPQSTGKQPGVEIADHHHPGVFQLPEVPHEVLSPIAASENRNIRRRH